jgi:hypothetical protein
MTTAATPVSSRAVRASGAPDLSGSQQRRLARKRVRRPWWRGPAPLAGTVVLVVALVGAFIVISNRSDATSLIGKAVPASLLAEVTSVPASVIDAVGTGGLPVPLHAISGPALTADGKPELLFVGAEFCPHCAADRWSVVNALSRFGTFSNLHYMRSAAGDGDIATLTFYGGSRYTSKYLTFLPLENEDRDGQSLQSLNTQQQDLFSTIGNSGYPFVDFAGRFANGASNAYSGGYDPSTLSGKDWSQIAGALSDANDPITRAVIGNANYQTAAICKLTHDQPASACKPATIQQIEHQLP